MKVIFSADVECPQLFPHWAPRPLAARPLPSSLENLTSLRGKAYGYRGCPQNPDGVQMACVGQPVWTCQEASFTITHRTPNQPSSPLFLVLYSITMDQQTAGEASDLDNRDENKQTKPNQNPTWKRHTSRTEKILHSWNKDVVLFKKSIQRTKKVRRNTNHAKDVKLNAKGTSKRKMKSGEDGKERGLVRKFPYLKSKSYRKLKKRGNITNERVQENFPELQDTSGPVEKAHCTAADPQQGTSLWNFRTLAQRAVPTDLHRGRKEWHTEFQEPEWLQTAQRECGKQEDKGPIPSEFLK